MIPSFLRIRVCVRACVCARVCVCVYVCVCGKMLCVSTKKYLPWWQNKLVYICSVDTLNPAIQSSILLARCARLSIIPDVLSPVHLRLRVIPSQLSLYNCYISNIPSGFQMAQISVSSLGYPVVGCQWTFFSSGTCLELFIEQS